MQRITSATRLLRALTAHDARRHPLQLLRSASSTSATTTTALAAAAAAAPLERQLDTVMVLLSNASSLSPLPHSSLPRVAAGLLAVFSRAASAREASPLPSLPPAGAPAGGVSRVPLSYVGATLERLRVLLQLQQEAGGGGGSLAAHVLRDARFSLLLQCASYQLSAAAPAPAAGATLAALARLSGDLALFLVGGRDAAAANSGGRAEEDRARALAQRVMLQAADAACALLPACRREGGGDGGVGAAVALLRALSHWVGGVAAVGGGGGGGEAGVPLAALDALALHLFNALDDADGGAACDAGALPLLAEAAALFRWWSDAPAPARACAARAGGEGPESTSGRYGALVERLCALLPRAAAAAPAAPAPAAQLRVLYRAAWHVLFCAAEGGAEAAADGRADDEEPLGAARAAALALRALLSAPPPPPPPPPGGGNAAAAAEGAAAAASFSLPGLLRATHLLVGCCAPGGGGGGGEALTLRNALLAPLLHELSARLALFEVAYLSSLDAWLRDFSPPSTVFRALAAVTETARAGAAASARVLEVPAPVVAAAAPASGGGGSVALVGALTPPTSLPPAAALALPPLPPSLWPPFPQEAGSCGGGGGAASRPPPAVNPAQLLSLLLHVLPLAGAPLPGSGGAHSVASAAARLASAGANVAVLHAMAGDSGGRQEAALVAAAADAGLAHGGLYKALGRRLMARGQRGDARLSLLPAPALIAALHALCLAREFEPRAFEAVVEELARRHAAAAEAGAEAARAAARGSGGAAAAWALPPDGGGGDGGDAALPLAARPPPPTFWGRGSATDWVEGDAAAAAAAAAAVAASAAAPGAGGGFLSAARAPPPLPFSRAPPFSVHPPPTPGAAEPPLDPVSAARLHGVVLTMERLSPFPALAARLPAPLRAAAAAAAPEALLLAAAAGGGAASPAAARATAAALLSGPPPPALFSSAPPPAQPPPPSPLPLLIAHVSRVLRAAAVPEPQGGGGGEGAPAEAPPRAQPRLNLVSILTRLSRLKWSARARAEAGGGGGGARAAAAAEPHLETSEEWEVPTACARLAARARACLDLTAVPGLRRELRRVPPAQHGALLVQPLRPAAGGILIHVALPMHRLALEIVGGPESAVAAPSGGAPPSLSLRTQWRAAVLAADGWRVVYVPVGALAGSWTWHAAGGGCLRPAAGALAPLATAATLARLLPELQRA
jgi:hypothetical protein